MKLSEYLKQNGMTTEEYFKMQKRKEEGKTSLSDYQRRLYQEIKSSDFSDIVKSLNSNEFLDQETLSYYNDRVSQVADKVSRFQMGDAESNKSFLDNLKTLQDGIGKASEYYSTFKDENDYKTQLKSIEQKKEWASADTKALKTEIDDLESKHKSYVGLKTERDNLFSTIASGYMRAGYSRENAEKAAASDGRIAKYDKELSQYGDMSNAGKTLSEKKKFYNNATKVQEGIALRDNAKNAEDFDKYSKAGADISNPTLDEAFGGFAVGDWRPFGKKIGNKVTYSRENYDEALKKASEASDNKQPNVTPYGVNPLYTQMNDEEVAIYNYYLSKEGEEKANQFLESITESLNYRQAEIDYEKMYQNKPVFEYLFSVAAGLDQWTSGVKSLFNTEGEYVSPSSIQMMSGMIREDLGEDYGIVGQGIYDLGTTTANMLPSILVSTMTGNIAGSLGAGVKAAQTIGKLAGAATLGSSAAGNGYQEMLNLGYDKSQAKAYGTLVGLSEAGLEYALGGISSLGGKFSGGITNTVVNKLISNVDNAIAKVAIGAGGKLVGSMVSEFGEEYLQEVLDPVFKNITLHTDEDIKLFSTEALYSGILGALSAGLLEGGSTISGEVATYKQGKAVKDSGQLSNLKKFGTSFSADTVAYKIASQVNENTDAYTIGQLLHEAGADSLSETNIAEITKSLERKNISPEHAETIAKWLNKAVEGGYFTKSQIKALENPDIAKTFKDVIINQNSTVNQRMQSYTDILQNIATEKENQKAAKTKAKAEKKANKNAQATEETKTTPFVPYSNEALNASKIEAVAKELENSGVSPELAQVMAQRKVLSQTEDISTSNTENAVESKFEVNLEGKTVNVKSGEDVKVSEIASIKDGKMVLKLDNGETVDAEHISFGTEDEGIIYSTVLDMGVNAAVANSLVKNYNPSDKLSGKQYALGIKEAYKYGSYGMPIGEISKKGFAADLSEAQRTHAYNLGKADMAAKVEKAQKEVEKVVSGKVGIEGKVYFKGDELALKSVQRESLKRMGVLSEVLGVEFHVFESYMQGKNRVYKDENGEIKKAPNGYYKDGKIYIDLNAGKDGQGIMIYTVAHELTHWIREWSPAKFKVLADFLMEQYGEKGHGVNDLVQAQIDKAKRNGRTIDFDTAYEEVVADSMETMLSDDAVYEKILELKAKDESIVKKIGEFFAKIIDSFKKLMQQYPPETLEGKLVADMHDSFSKLQELFAEALVDASNNYQANEGQKNTTSEGGVKFMARNNTNIDKLGYNADNISRANKQGELINEFHTALSGSEWVAFNKKLSENNFLERFKIGTIARFVIGDKLVISERKRITKDTHDYQVTAVFKIKNSVNYNQALYEVKELMEGSYEEYGEERICRSISKLIQMYDETALLYRFDRNSKRFVMYISKEGNGNSSSGIYQDNQNGTTGGELSLKNKQDIQRTAEPIKESARDTLGNTLTEAQQTYFAESKVRDENGNLKVMYHGTPNATFTKFRSGTYFTEHKEYADNYQSQGASSLSYKKTADNPDTYAVYLDIKKPFDTRNKAERDIFYNEYYRQWGTGTDLMESGLPDWLDGQDLQEFLEEQGYDYDGLILDEGATGGYGEEVTSRGLSYVVFNPEQVKSVDNKNPTKDADYRFSMRENVEETKDLVAVHNLSEEKLLKSLELGGLPMPSIAIARAKEGHSDFGKISLVFNKDTIDPQNNRNNKVFSGDAWTPTYPRVEYKISYDAAEKVSDKINKLLAGTDYKTAFGYLSLDSDSIQDYFNRNNGDVYDAYGRKEAFKLAFLKDKGVELELPSKEKQFTHRFDNDVIVEFANKYGKDKIVEMQNYDNTAKVDQHIPEIKEMVERYYSEQVGKEMDWQIDRDDVYTFIDGAGEYFSKGIVKNIDTYAARDVINSAIDENEYKSWLNDLFSDIVEKEGIRNNKDIFTPSGNRRSFEALHYEHNLENVIKAMKGNGEKGIGSFGGGNIFGASTTEYNSISEIKEASQNRLQKMSQEEYEEIKKGFSDRFFELAYSLPIHKDSFTATDDAMNMLIEAVTKFKTKSGMANYLRSESKGWANYSDYVVDDLIELVNDIRNMPVDYFEAKPQRAVGFNEVATAIIPDNSSDELKAKLNDNGIKFVEYDDGNEESRLKALNSLEDVKFSDRDSAYMDAINNGDMETAQRLVDEAAKEAGYNYKGYHGTSADFNNFDYSYIGDDNKLGLGFYFTNNEKLQFKYDYEKNAYLRLDNPIFDNNPIIDDILHREEELRESGLSQEETLKAIQNEFGYDGIVAEYNRKALVAFNPNQIKSADPVTYDDNGNVIPLSERFNAANEDIRYSERVTDEETLDFLNEQIKKGEYIKVYRSFQVIDGGLYAPMNAVDRDENGKNKRLGYRSEYGVWEKSTESPEIAQRYMDNHPEAPYAKFDLDGVDNKTNAVAYNPYLHASNLVLNDQFAAAYRRNLITVECYVPLSEADGTYKAQYAKDATGWVDWKAGGVAGKLLKVKPEYTRKLFVSRYMLPVRQVPDSEVAAMYKEYLDGTDIAVPWNVVTPSLRNELEKAGVNISYDDVKAGSKTISFNDVFSDDVKFSDRDPNAAENTEKINKQLAKENLKLIEDVKYLKELVKLQGKETHGKMLKKSTVELVAKRLMAYQGAKGNVSELVGHLTDVYSYIAQGEDVSWEGIQEKSQAAVDWLMQNEYHKQVRDEYADSVLKELRTMRISLDDAQKAEVAYRYGSFNNFRKKNMGRIIITNDGISLDSAWQELAENHPMYFDKDTNSTDQPIMLMEIIDGLQNTYATDEYHYYSDEMVTQDLMTKVYEGYWDVSALHTVADAKQKEINLLKAKHRESMDALRESHKESDAKLRQEHREKISELRTQYREREEAKVKKVAEYYQKSRKEAVDRVKETREKRDAITKLQRVVLDTAKWVSYPKKDDVKCPDILRSPYAEFLSSIDLSSKRLLNGGEPTQNDLRVASAMDSLAKAIEKKLGTQNPNVDTETVLDTGYLDLPVHFVDNLKELAEDLKKRMEVDGHIVNAMTSEEVKTLTKLIKTLNHSIKEMSTLYSNMRFARVEQLGNDTMVFLKYLGEAKQTNSITNFVTWDNALPYYTFKRFGVAGESVFEELMDAQDKLAYLADEIFKFKEKTWTDKEASEWSKDTHTIKLPSGRELTLTSSDAMSIYCLSRREQGRQHLLGGGVRVLGIEKNGKKANDSRSLLNQQDILAIASSLTERQIKVAEAIQEYMSTVCSEWGNEISMKRFLTKEFTEKFYFPIESNDENLDTKDPKAQQSDLYRLLNISATKPLTKGANNEVIIRNVFDVFTNHSSDMAKLNAYGMALLDYMKWINYREKTVNDDGQISVSGVRKSMERAYGSEAKKYIIGLIKDINGRTNDGGDHPFLMKMTRTAKTAMVGANLRVAALQFTAYPRAAMVLSNKSLALGLTKVPQIEKAKKYCGIALWKSFGFYDTNISRSIEDQLKGTTNIRQKLIELSLKGAEWGDSITWGCLWNACEYEVAKTKQYKVGSEEFNQAVGKKLREVVYATQVVDSTLTRSQMMRNKSGLTQSASAFMSEPTLSANILMDAGFQFNLEKRRTGSAKLAWQKTGKHIGKAVAVYSIGQIIVALAEAIQDAYRDDDDEEFMAKFGEAFKENAISDLNPFNKIPIIADVSDLIMSWFGIGFSSSNSLYLQAVDEANNAFETWQKVINGEGGKTVYAGIYSTTKLLSYITGVSASGLMREVVTLWNNTAGATDPYLKIRTYESSATDKNIAEYKFDKGDTAGVKIVVSKMVDEKKANVDPEKVVKGVKKKKTSEEIEKEAKSAVRSSFTSTYKPEYMAAVEAKDFDEMNRIRKFLYATGLYGTLSELDEALKKWRTGE